MGLCALIKKIQGVSLLGKNAGGKEAGWKGLVIIVNFEQEQLRNLVQVVRVGGFSYMFWHSDLWSLNMEIGCGLKWAGQDLTATHVLK